MTSEVKNLIRKIEQIRKSKVIVYFTGDRRFGSARIAEDAVRPLYDHLLALKFPKTSEKRIDLFLYSRGGNVSVPWRIVSMIREFCDEFNVLIPYRAQSAATLLSLGADNIIMGKKAELGPIDPTLVKAKMEESSFTSQEIAVEDVNSFLSFIKDRAHLNDQDAVAKMINRLIDKIGPLTLGNVNRQHYHIRLVARKLLTTRREKMDEEKIGSIIETLTEKIYSHGHGIGRREAKDLGLPIIFPEPKLEELMWRLYLIYEKILELQNPIEPWEILKDKDTVNIENMPIAIIESMKNRHIYKITLTVKKKRRIPPNPQININLSINLPNIDLQKLPVEVKKKLDEILKSSVAQLREIVLQELIRQSEVAGIEINGFGGRWYNE